MTRHLLTNHPPTPRETIGLAHPGWLPAAVSLADARRAGWSERRLHRAGFWAPSRGVRYLDQPAGLLEMARAARPVLDDGGGQWAFSHQTAAELLGLPTRQPWRPGDSVHVIVTDRCPPRRRGFVGHPGLEMAALARWKGLPVVRAVEVWAQLGGQPGYEVEHLVAAGDAIVRHRPDLVQALHEVADRPRRRGARQLRRAADLIRVGADSAPESVLRLVLTAAGMPEPLLQVELWEGHVLVAIFDLYHRTDAQAWRRDRVKPRIYAQLGILSLPVTATDLATPSQRAALGQHFRSIATGRGPARGADLRHPEL